MAGDRSPVFFTDALVWKKDWILLASELRALEDDDESDLTRVFTFKAGDWSFFDLDSTAIVSVAKSPSNVGGAFLLAKDGNVFLSDPSGESREKILDAGTGPGKLGYVTQIRHVEGQYFACGASGQVYRREESQWIHFDEGVRNPADGSPAAVLFSIDGTEPNNLFVVGQGGAIFHFEGDRWIRERGPSKEIFRWVRALAPDRVFACGRRGLFLRRKAEGWGPASNVPTRADFWCVEGFEEKVYLAGSDGLYVFDGDSLQPLDTGIKPPVDANRLYANDGRLWSVGPRHLCFFDGKKWTYVKHPDNPE